MHHFSQELEALTSQQNGLDGTTYSIANGKSFPVKSSSTISPTPNNMKTSKTLTQLSIEDELMSSAEDSPANHSARQDFEKEQRTTATCGRRCLELSESVNPVGSWARTFAGLLVGRTDWYSKRVTLTWKILGTPSNRLLFQLVPQAMRHTDVTEFGLLLTPTTQIQQMLPTPRSVEFVETPENFAKRNGDRTTNSMPNLSSMAQHVPHLLPTPAARDVKGTNSMEHLRGENGTVMNHIGQLPNFIKYHTGTTSQLSPLFVEEMMGFPKNWTVLPFQNGEENQ